MQKKNIRPQSAKVAPRIITATQQLQQISQQMQDSSIQTFKNFETLKPNNSHKKLKTLIKKSRGELQKIIPKHIPQQKQRLYCERINLKENLHAIQNQNIKLKTRIATLQKENEKLNNYIVGEKSNNNSSQYYSSIRPFYNQKQTSIILNLKKILKNSKQQIANLTNECQKMKRLIKYTQINELQLEKKCLVDQTTRLKTIIQHLVSNQKKDNDNQKKIQQLEKQIKQRRQLNEVLSQTNFKYEQEHRYLQGQLRELQENTQQRQKKMLIDLNNARKRLIEVTKKQEFYIKEINYLKQKKKKEDQLNPKNNKIQINSFKKQGSNNHQNQILKQKNNELQNQLNRINKVNQDLQNQIQKLKSQINQLQPTQQSQDNQNYQDSFSSEKKVQEPIKPIIDKKVPSLVVIQKSENQLVKQYQDEQFQENPSQEEQKEQILYQKDTSNRQQYEKQNNPPAVTITTEEKKSRKKKNKKSSQIIQIGELLIYRMKAQRYTFKQLKQDLMESQTQYFSSEDLFDLFQKQPFYLSKEQTTKLLEYVFDSEMMVAGLEITKQTLIKKLKKIISDFDLLDQKVEQQMCIRIEEMLETYAKELQSAFSKKLKGEGTISKQNIQQLFVELQLQKPYIELIIAQLALTSTDLNHLNYRSFFKRYYKQNESYENTIKQEHMQQSGEKFDRKPEKKNQKISYEDDQQYNQYLNEQDQLEQYNNQHKELCQSI